MVALMAPAGSLARAQAFQNEATVAAGPNVTIDAVSSRHTISPYIYGTNYDQNQIPDMNPSIIRWGGDGTSQYNWQTGSTNAGSDWYFINGNQNNVTNPPDFDTFLATNQNAGIKTIGTIPINGWVAKDGGACAFSVKKYGAQQAVDPYTSDCGNGIMPDGKTPITPSKTTDPADADVSEPASFMQDWVTYVVSTYGATANGGVAIWELDNEPVWWKRRAPEHPSARHRPRRGIRLLSSATTPAHAVRFRSLLDQCEFNRDGRKPAMRVGPRAPGAHALYKRRN